MRTPGLQVRCDRCGADLETRFDVDMMGGTVELVKPCTSCINELLIRRGAAPTKAPPKPKRRGNETAAEAERRRQGVCRWCPKPVAGRKGVAAFCADCRLKQQRLRDRARHRVPGRRATPGEGRPRTGLCGSCGEKFTRRMRGRMPKECPKCRAGLLAEAAQLRVRSPAE